MASLPEPFYLFNSDLVTGRGILDVEAVLSTVMEVEGVAGTSSVSCSRTTGETTIVSLFIWSTWSTLVIFV